MKTLLIFFALTITILGQVSLDSARVKYAGDSVYELWGRATFIETPDAADYKVGFVWGENAGNLTFAPMGIYWWNNTLKQLTWKTQLVNLPEGEYVVAPQIMPKNVIITFETTDIVGWIE